jgi:cysteinyl-tRNA synthetase
MEVLIGAAGLGTRGVCSRAQVEGRKMPRTPGELTVYNTLTGSKESLRTLRPGKVNLFVCGPTVYDYPHLGHAKTYTQFDLIVRYLRHKGYDVFYLQNVTDIDDKIIRRAGERGVGWDELAREFESIYMEDMAALGNTAVSRYARATDFIGQIVSQVERLMEKGFAYRNSSGIYYDLTRFPDYGKLSGRTEPREEHAVSRVDEGAGKRNRNDFCLWKAAKHGEPSWDTPLGPGRPGWHIEDTAITEAFFGAQYDAHGGAVDLIFPHHEAEIAQMEAVSGFKPLAGHWLHTGLLNVGSRKMSKSSGNFTTIREALRLHGARVLRFFFVSSHYRAPMDFTESSFEQARGALARIDEFTFRVDPGLDDAEASEDAERLRRAVYGALDDDFNTPRAFAAVFDFIRARNVRGRSGRRCHELLRELDGLFGVFDFNTPAAEGEVMRLIAERQEHRARRDYARADEIRSRLLGMGIQLYDTAEGVKWKKASP